MQFSLSLLCLTFTVAASLRINCGGGKLGGIVGDALAPSGTVGRFSGTNKSPESIYTTHAFANNKKLIYTILAPGTKDGYDVKLYFMENNPAFFGEGKRVFDVYIMGNKEQGELDVWKKSDGPFKSFVYEKSGIKPVQGKLWIELVGKQAMISGIDIFVKDSKSDAGAVQEGFTNGPADPEPELITEKPKNMKPQTQPNAGGNATQQQPTTGLKITWKRIQDDYPLRVFEASGTVMGTGDDKALVVVGGFKDFPGVTTASYQRKFTSGKATWQLRAFYPRAQNDVPGVTHMAQCLDPVNPNLIYYVGGYAGRHPGNSINTAYEYNRVTNSYKSLPNLPGDRAGGGCVVVRKNGKRDLVYTGGVDRVFPSFFMHIDHSESWTLNLHSQSSKWLRAGDIKNARNHMAGVESCGRYFFVGGQKRINEKTGNQNTVSEYFSNSRSFTDNTIANLPYGLGHVSASVMSWKCDLIVVGGIVNGAKLSDNILHWNHVTNQWKVIGKYPHKVATPVCGISGDQIICATGGDNEFMRNYVYHGKIAS